MYAKDFTEVIALVKREAKSEASSEEVEWLNRPENLSMWKEALAAAIDDVCEQFAAHKEAVDRVRTDVVQGIATPQVYDAAVEQYEGWKKKASRYRLGLEHRLREVKSRERTRNVMATDAAKTLIQLLNAIEVHKSQTLDLRIEPTQADVELWESFTGVKIA